MRVVLALGFDLFFKPRLAQAAREAEVEVRHATPADAVARAEGASHVVADVSAPGVPEALAALRRARPDLPILACYPHVEAHRVQAVLTLGRAAAVTRGTFSADLVGALRGTLGP